MKITYTAPNRAHHYPYAEALYRADYLHAFISGFSRFSPRAPLPGIGDKLKRRDLFQNLYLASLKFNMGYGISSKFNYLTNFWLDRSSYKSAKESDVFIYYRTEGYTTTQRLKKRGSSTVCILEEVNSHVDYQYSILQDEYRSLGLGSIPEKIPDHAQRLAAYENADYILCPSEFVRRSFIEKGFSPGRLLKVNFGFSNGNHHVTNTRKHDKESFRVLYVGQLNFRKGLRYAIAAFNRVKHPNKEFVIVGPKSGITGLENISLPKEVIFTGTLKGDELNDQYRRASIFVLPSLEEGLALVQLEALSFGVPLLITTHTGGDDIITDGLQGFIVPPANEHILADRMQQMADDPLLLENMSVKAFEAARTYGSWDLAVQKLAQLLQPILKANN